MLFAGGGAGRAARLRGGAGGGAERERMEDVLRIAALRRRPLDALQGAQLLWLDRLGIYLLPPFGGHGAQVRF